MELASPIPLLNFAHFAKYSDAPSNQQDPQNYLRGARRAARGVLTCCRISDAACGSMSCRAYGRSTITLSRTPKAMR